MSIKTDIVTLIKKVAATGREKGMNQAQIARTAGMADETLSRIKRNPNIGLEHFATLAHAAGLKLILVPDDPVIEKIEQGGLFEP